MYEDDLPGEQKKQTGERMGLVREMVRYGALRGCTNKFYAGGTSRATVAATITYNLLNKVSRSLLGNRGKVITRVLPPSTNYNTAAVEAGFLVFAHTDMEHDIRALPNFIEVAKYGTRKPIHPMELGSSGRYRFIISPELGSVIDSGAAVGSTGLFSTGAANIDVYPCIVVAENAFADLALRGMDSFDFTNLKPGEKTKSDPHGQRGYVGAKFYAATFVQNDGWMAVVEAGVTSL
jgi:N4-gp56 family major capsid protein